MDSSSMSLQEERGAARKKRSLFGRSWLPITHPPQLPVPPTFGVLLPPQAPRAPPAPGFPCPVADGDGDRTQEARGGKAVNGTQGARTDGAWEAGGRTGQGLHVPRPPPASHAPSPMGTATGHREPGRMGHGKPGAERARVAWGGQVVDRKRVAGADGHEKPRADGAQVAGGGQVADGTRGAGAATGH
ncbi:hypothetical protein EYF80_003216 [Liparis tanakae]|uniref:Uncharacterized protein n=1 Tax=Liparis tanakae TaxID=230148 RepID=A0A4Z2J8A6_9TELE|nr:hypothetical protein EYF80_003216 [Liparis tanakae]